MAASALATKESDVASIQAFDTGVQLSAQKEMENNTDGPQIFRVIGAVVAFCKDGGTALSAGKECASFQWRLRSWRGFRSQSTQTAMDSHQMWVALTRRLAFNEASLLHIEEAASQRFKCLPATLSTHSSFLVDIRLLAHRLTRGAFGAARDHQDRRCVCLRTVASFHAELIACVIANFLMEMSRVLVEAASASIPVLGDEKRRSGH